MTMGRLFGTSKRAGVGVLAAVVAATGAAGTGAAATGAAEPQGRVQAQRPCSLRTLRGSYIFTATGYTIVAGVAQPKAIVEAIDFHGDGTLLVPAATVSLNGVVARSSGVGLYSLDDACRGTLTFTPGPSFDIFADPTGQQVWMIQTNPNNVLQGAVTRIKP
jgi:hypothetical protein